MGSLSGGGMGTLSGEVEGGGLSSGVDTLSVGVMVMVINCL